MSRGLEREPLDAIGVRREQLAQVKVANRRVVTAERLPGGAVAERVGHVVAPRVVIAALS